MVILSLGTNYWFRSRAFDGRFESPWSPARALKPRNAQPALTSEDFDGDGVVGFSDFFLFASGYGSTDAVLDLDRGGQSMAMTYNSLRRDSGAPSPAKGSMCAALRPSPARRSKYRRKQYRPMRSSSACA